MQESKDQFHLAMRRLNLQISLLLRIFTILSLLLLTAGLTIMLLSTGRWEAEVVSISNLPQELCKLNPAALITLAIYSILAMPALVVLTSFTYFFRTHEIRSAIICILLLSLLAISFIFILT